MTAMTILTAGHGIRRQSILPPTGSIHLAPTPFPQREAHLRASSRITTLIRLIMWLKSREATDRSGILHLRGKVTCLPTGKDTGERMTLTSSTTTRVQVTING